LIDYLKYSFNIEIVYYDTSVIRAILAHELFEYKGTSAAIYLVKVTYYRVSQNSGIPNSERGTEGPSGARKILRKKNSLFLKKI
jgi:hypothetical protein